MKRFWLSFAYWGLCGLLFAGIVKVSGASNYLHAFSHSLEIHGNEDKIKDAAERRMRLEAEERKNIAHLKEREERSQRERKEQEVRERRKEQEEQKKKKKHSNTNETKRNGKEKEWKNKHNTAPVPLNLKEKKHVSNLLLLLVLRSLEHLSYGNQ